MTIIGISDSAASPVVIGSEHAFVADGKPTIFSSTFGTLALMETLMAFVVAEAGDEVVTNIRNFHQRRLALGLYMES